MADYDLACIVLLGAQGHGKTTLARALLDEAVQSYGSTASRMTTHLEYRLAARHVRQFDPPRGCDVATSLFSMAPPDAVVAVVSLEAGVVPQTHEHLHVARCAGVDRAVIHLSHGDVVLDADLRTLVEEEARDAVEKAGMCVEAISYHPRDVGDALQRLPLAVRDPEAPFLMTVEESSSMKGLGTVVLGTVLRGQARHEDPLELVGEGTRSTTITAAETGRSRVDAVREGQDVAVLLRGMDLYVAWRAQLLASPGTVQERSTVTVELRGLATEEGGTGDLLQDGDVHWCLFATARSVAHLRTRRLITSAHTTDVALELETPVAVAEGMPFVLRSSAATVAVGKVRLDGPRSEPPARRPAPRLIETLCGPGAVSRSAVATLLEALLTDEPLAWSALDDVHAAIEALDRRVRAQLSLVVEHPSLQRLATIWRNLHDVVELAPTGRGRHGEVEVLNVSRADMVEDMGGSPDVHKCGLWRIVYGGNYGSVGGQPYSVLVYDEPLGDGDEDERVLAWSAYVARRAAAVVLIGHSAVSEGSSNLEGGELVVVDPRSPYELARLVQDSFHRYGWGAHVPLQSLGGPLADSMIPARLAMVLMLMQREYCGYDAERLHDTLRRWLARYDDLVRGELAIRSVADEPRQLAFELTLRPRWRDAPLRFEGRFPID